MFSFAGGRTKCIGRGRSRISIYMKRKRKKRGSEGRSEKGWKGRRQREGNSCWNNIGWLWYCQPLSRCSRVPLISFPGSLYLSVSFLPSSLPPTLSVTFIVPFRSVSLRLSLSLSLSLSLFLFSSGLAFSSSTYPSHGLVRRWNIVEQRIDGCWEGWNNTPFPPATPPTPPLALPLAPSFSFSSTSSLSSFSFIRSLNAANKNNTTSTWRGDVRGLRRIIKITLPTNPPPLFDRTIAGSLARAVDADVADVLSFWSCEKFETHLVLFLLFFSYLFSLSLSLSLSLPLSFFLFISSAFHPGFSRNRSCSDTSDYIWWLCTLNWEQRAYVLIFLQIARRPCFSFASVHLRKPAFLGNFR